MVNYCLVFCVYFGGTTMNPIERLIFLLSFIIVPITFGKMLYMFVEDTIKAKTEKSHL